MDRVVVGGDDGEEVKDKLFKFAEENGEVSTQLVFGKVKEVVEGGREEDRAIPIKNMKDGARKSEMESLDDLSGSELEHGVYCKDYLEEGKGLGCRVVLKDMLASHSEEGGELGREGEKI